MPWSLPQHWQGLSCGWKKPRIDPNKQTPILRVYSCPFVIKILPSPPQLSITNIQFSQIP
jgi:hypothetical protein